MYPTYQVFQEPVVSPKPIDKRIWYAYLFKQGYIEEIVLSDSGTFDQIADYFVSIWKAHQGDSALGFYLNPEDLSQPIYYLPSTREGDLKGPCYAN